MLYWVMYDISDNKIRNKAVKECKNKEPGNSEILLVTKHTLLSVKYCLISSLDLSISFINP